MSPHFPDASGADSLLLTRRSLLRLGVIGTVALGSASMVAGLSGCSSRQEAQAKGFQFLRDADVQLFKALIPTVLGDVVQSGDSHYQALETHILKNVDTALANLGRPAQGELLKLFDLLHLRATRWLTTGVWADWKDASAEDLSNFLSRWRASGIGPFNAGYRVLTKLVGISYYSLPDSWRFSGYPGPMPALYQAANAA